jgi:Planctomycete cytochrome C
MKKQVMYVFTLATVIALVAACKHHPDVQDVIGNNGNNGGGNVNPPDTIEIINTDPCDPDSVYFTNTILPLINSHCATEDCHDAISHREGVRLYDYTHIMQQVTPGSPNNSDLWDSMNENGEDAMPPSDYPQFTAQEMQMIQTWILQGAQNNSCTADCDPTQGSYANNILPVVNLTCGGCHGNTNPSGNLSLTNYSQISASALDGGLMNSLHGINGVSLMPQNTTGLPDCYIQQFQNWVDAGAPNN